MQDLHQALKFEQVGRGRAQKAGVDFVVVRGQSSKDDIAFGLHAAPNQYTSSGIQTPDFMSLLGFARSGCQFVDTRECFSRAIHKEFDLASFVARFDEGLEELKQAERHLEACGLFFDQMEGWDTFSESTLAVEANGRSTSLETGIPSRNQKSSRGQRTQHFGTGLCGSSRGEVTKDGSRTIVPRTLRCRLSWRGFLHFLG